MTDIDYLKHLNGRCLNPNGENNVQDVLDGKIKCKKGDWWQLDGKKFYVRSVDDPLPQYYRSKPYEGPHHSILVPDEVLKNANMETDKCTG